MATNGIEDDFPELVYLSDCPELKVDAPVGCPHLVDPSTISEEFTQKNLTIADLVATILFRYRPEALRAFLDLKRNHVRYLRREALSSSFLDFCIQRKGKVVTVSHPQRSSSESS